MRYLQGCKGRGDASHDTSSWLGRELEVCKRPLSFVPSRALDVLNYLTSFLTSVNSRVSLLRAHSIFTRSHNLRYDEADVVARCRIGPAIFQAETRRPIYHWSQRLNGTTREHCLCVDVRTYDWESHLHKSTTFCTPHGASGMDDSNGVYTP